MYLKLIYSDGSVSRYHKVKKRDVLSLVHQYNASKKCIITINLEKKKLKVDISFSIKLLAEILQTKFHGNITEFDICFSRADMYVSNTSSYSTNLLIVFGETIFDVATCKAYNVDIIAGNILMKNKREVDF